MQEGADLNIAFDPKWSQVAALCFLEGPDGQTVVAGERGAAFTLNNCAVSTTVSRWGRGSVFFPSDTITKAVSGATLQFVSNQPQVIQHSFYPTDVSGSRFVFSYYDRVSLTIDSGSLTLRVRTTSNPTPEYVISMPGVEVGQWYDYSIRLNSTGASLEINGDVVGAVTWGSEPHGTINAGFRLGNYMLASTPAQSFRGYLAPFRWTIGDQRTEDAGQPAYRFPVLGAVDSIREKVVFHSRFEGLNNATSAVDTKGKTIAFSGAARLSTGYRKFGVSCFHASGGTGFISHSDFQFGTDDFTIEFFCARDGNTGNREYLFALMDESGVDHALSLSGQGFDGTGYLRVAGVDVASASPVSPAQITFYHYAVVRKGADLSVFRNGTRVLTYNIGSASINSNGQFYIGKGGTAAPGSASLYDYIDELRITRRAARHNPALTSIVAPPEFFSEYGPRAISGHVDDADGNPVDCVVRVHRSLTGQMVSEGRTAADGSFVLPVADIDEHYWTAHLPGKNALIFDHVVPELVT